MLAGLETATKSGCDRQFGHPEPASSVGNLYLLVGYDHFDQPPTIQAAGTTITADFLGYTFRGELRLPRKKSLDKLKETVRAKTRRTNGSSLACIVDSLSRTLQGWFGYFEHCHWTVFSGMDSWVRMRLRSILRRRKGGEGRGRGSDHQRWPNSYFAKHGLLSLGAAHARLSQSLTGP